MGSMGSLNDVKTSFTSQVFKKMFCGQVKLTQVRPRSKTQFQIYGFKNNLNNSIIGLLATMPLRKSKITHLLLILSLFGSKNFYSAQNVASKGIQDAHSLPYLNLCGPTLIAFITIFGQNQYIPVRFSILKFLKHSNRRV